MTNNVKVQITNAVYEVYKNTTEPYYSSASGKIVEFVKPTELGTVTKGVRISRVKDKRGVVYELHIDDDKIPFMTVFGCWPIGFVADIFIRALEHYYDWY